MQNSNRITSIFLIFIGLILFGCVSSSQTGSGSGSDLDRVAADARSDPTKLLLRFSYGDNETPFSGVVHFLSDSGRKDFSVPVQGFLSINRSEVCSDKAEKYDELLVTFGDSPAEETWTWGNARYCESYSFYMTVDSAQMQMIKNPKNPEYLRASATVNLDRKKMMFYILTDDNSTVSGNATFISASGNKSIRIQAYTLVDSSDFCDGKRVKYSNMSVTFDASPIGEKRYWSDLDYCSYNRFALAVDAADLEGMKNPMLDLSLFEYDNFTGKPINATVHCGDTRLGQLTNGHLNISRVDLLKQVDTNCTLSFTGNIQIYNDIYNFDFCGWELRHSDIIDYSIFELNLNDTTLHYFRTVPCSTAKSYVAPNDSMVSFRLQRYFPYKTGDANADVEAIFDALAKEFQYNNSEAAAILTKGAGQYLLPSEFFNSNGGVCLDWSNAFLSLVLARDPSTPCYSVYADFIYANGSSFEKESHATVFCAINGIPRIYDQTQKYIGSSIWKDLFDGLDWKGSGDPIQEGRLSKQGIVGVKPTAYYNDKLYVKVDGITDMYNKLGIKS